MTNLKRLSALLLCAALLIIALPLQTFAASNFPTVLAETKKGVVKIYGLSDNGYLLTSWTGTGFAVGEAGKDSDIFLTNQHVVSAEDGSSSDEVRIWILQENCEINDRTLEPDPNRSIACEVLKTTDGYPDYAIIRATEPIEGYKALPLLSSETVPDGLTVYALGYPGVVDDASANHYGIDDITSTNGIISQHMQYTSADNTWVLMHTAQISGGNSGGPLITEEGAVVGLNTYGFGENRNNVNRYCAVYIDYAIQGLDELGLPYELFGAQDTETNPTETQETAETQPKTTDPKEEEDPFPVLPVAIGCAAAAVLAAIIILLTRRKKKQQEEEILHQEAERRRLEDERRKKEDERRRLEDERRRQEDERRKRTPQETIVAQIQLNGKTIYPVPASGCVIGRDYDCNIILPENTPGVSRHHCKLEFYQGQLILTDEQSKYGTYIHGTRIPANTRVALKKGSSFCLGSEQCKFTVC